MGARPVITKYTDLTDGGTVNLPALNAPLAAALAAAGGGGPITFSSITDGATVDLPTVNGPLATALGLKADAASVSNVDNTSDLAKPISTATQAALDLKAPLISPSFTTPNLGTPSAGNLANCTFPTLNQSTTGNAATATALETGREINGVTFDGTANITITAAAGTLTGTTLAGTVIGSSLTSVGTITTGTWQGTAIPVAHGGTGATTAADARTSLGLGTGDYVQFAGVGLFSGSFNAGGGGDPQRAFVIGPRTRLRGIGSGGIDVRNQSDLPAEVKCADLTASGTVKTGAYTVATLPTPSTGMRAYVTDSSVAASGNFGATVVAGGANIVPVFYDGTNWVIA